MKYSEIQKINLSHAELIEAIKHARKEHFLDNLRDRNEFVAFDSKVRGYIGEIFLKGLFLSNGIKIRKIDYASDDVETDIDFEIESSTGEVLTIECKTSLVPDVYQTIENCIKRCDIKIIRREKHYTRIPIDIHIQIYFDELRKVRDTRLSRISKHVDDYNDEELFSLLSLDSLGGYFVAWEDKESLNGYLESLEMYERIWKFGFRSFWRCPLSNAKAPADLINFLKTGSIKKEASIPGHSTTKYLNKFK